MSTTRTTIIAIAIAAVAGFGLAGCATPGAATIASAQAQATSQQSATTSTSPDSTDPRNTPAFKSVLAHYETLSHVRDLYIKAGQPAPATERQVILDWVVIVEGHEADIRHAQQDGLYSSVQSADIDTLLDEASGVMFHINDQDGVTAMQGDFDSYGAAFNQFLMDS